LVDLYNQRDFIPLDNGALRKILKFCKILLEEGKSFSPLTKIGREHCVKILDMKAVYLSLRSNLFRLIRLAKCKLKGFCTP
jgi:hypothetical protein